MADFADCVEAHITGIAVIEKTKTINISMRGQTLQQFVLVGEEVDRLLVNEFREKNIVDRVVLWDSTSEPDAYREPLAALISGVNGKIDAAWQQVIEKEIALIQRGERVFVEIEPVYGAGIVFLAKRITFIPSKVENASNSK